MTSAKKIIPWAIIFALFAGVPWSRAAEPWDRLDLTQEEILFIKKHPVITLGAAGTFDPFIYHGEDGSYTGYDIDITNYISQITGLKFQFIIGDWKEVVQQAEQGRLDGLACSLPSPKRSKYFNFTIPYAEYSSIVLVRKGNPHKIYSMKDLDGKRAAVMSGNINTLNEALGAGKDIKIIQKPDTYGMIRSVVTDESDFIIGGEPAHYLAAKLGLPGMMETAFPTGATTKFCFSLNKKYPELVSILDKAIRSIPQDKMVAFRTKWLSGAAWDPVTREGRVKLTADEHDYLSVNHCLGVCVKGDQLPLSIFTSDGKLEGMDADFIRLAEKHLGPGVKLLPVKSPDPLQGLRKHTCDLVMTAGESENATPDIMYTTPFLSFPYVVVATIDKQFQTDFLPEPDQTFAVLKDSPVLSELKQTYPGIHIQTVSSISEGLSAVRDKQVFGMIVPSISVVYQIQKQFITELKILGQTPLTVDFATATRSDPPQLHKIFQKIIGSMSNEEVRHIVNKWIAVKYEKGVDYSLIWKIMAGAFLLLAGSAVWNRKLGAAKRRAEEALAAEREAVRANLNFIDMISHEYRSPLTVISSNLDLIEEKTFSGNGLDVSRELGRMRNSTLRLLNIFEKSLSQIRMDNATIRPNKKNIDIGHIVQSAIKDIHNAHPGHTIELKKAEDEQLLVHADPELFNVVAVNLLDNACKYSKSKSTVTVTLDIEGTSVMFTVRDQGVGINAGDLKHIFEKYYRSQNVGKKHGVGVGMYLVKSIADLHDWKIYVMSEEGKGTTVTVEAPLAQTR